jgi:hypothetical protein
MTKIHGLVKYGNCRCVEFLDPKDNIIAHLIQLMHLDWVVVEKCPHKEYF